MNKISIRDVKTAKNFNPRDNLNKEELEKIRSSMDERGQDDPIWLQEWPTGNPTNELIDGKHRLWCAKDLDWSEIGYVYKVVDDLAARELTLIRNAFGNRLNELEIARNVSMILDQVPRGNQTKKLAELANGLGRGRSTVEGYLTVWNGLCPDARIIAGKLLRGKLVKFERIAEISELHPDRKQKAILDDKIADMDDPIKVDSLIVSFLYGQEETKAESASSQSESDSGTEKSTEAAKKKLKYFTVAHMGKLKMAEVVRVESGGCWYKDAKSGKLVNLVEEFNLFLENVKADCLLSVNVKAELEKEAKRKIKVAA